LKERFELNVEIQFRVKQVTTKASTLVVHMLRSLSIPGGIYVGSRAVISNALVVPFYTESA
jgi:hypothetical protein